MATADAPSVLESAETIEELKRELARAGATLDPDPREVARGNQRRLDKEVGGVRRLYEAWVEREGSEPTSSRKALDIRLDDSQYLRDWSAGELFEFAKRAVDDSDFREHVAGCTTIKAMRERLGIRFLGGRRDERTQKPLRMIDVAGEPEPVDGTDENYRDIFERLNGPARATNRTGHPSGRAYGARRRAPEWRTSQGAAKGRGGRATRPEDSAPSRLAPHS